MMPPAPRRGWGHVSQLNPVQLLSCSQHKPFLSFPGGWVQTARFVWPPPGKP